MKRITNLFIVFALLSSCASTIHKSNRYPSSSLKSCVQKVTQVVKSKDTEPVPLSQLLKMRDDLRDKYRSVKNSVEDFDLKANPPVKGKVKVILNAEEGYLSKIMMIRNAKYTIDMSYYIFKNDDSAHAILHELRKAIKRGVKVRFQADSLGSIGSAPFHSEIKALSKLRGGKIRDMNGNLTEERASSEIVLFNPVVNIRAHVANWYKKTANLFLDEGKEYPIPRVSTNRRSHDKIIMVDEASPKDSMAIVGGRNIADYYYGLGKDPDKTYEDIELLVKNIATKNSDGTYNNALSRYYNKIFYYLANKNASDFLIPIGLRGIRRQFKKMRTANNKLLQDNKVLEKKLKEMEEADYLNKDFDEGLITMIHELQNLSRIKAFLKPMGEHNKKNGKSLVGRMRQRMEGAQKTIDIVSPYLWFTKEEMEFLKEWAAEDPTRKVRLITNSLTTSDNIPAQAMVDTILGPTMVSQVKGTPLEEQIEVYAFGKIDDKLFGGDKSYGKLHGKFTIIDDEIFMIGTSNLDPRSRYLNTEHAFSISEITSAGKHSIKRITKYRDELIKKSHLWGSEEWHEIRNHKKNNIVLGLQKFTSQVIHKFNLIPLI